MDHKRWGLIVLIVIGSLLFTACEKAEDVLYSKDLDKVIEQTWPPDEYEVISKQRPTTLLKELGEGWCVLLENRDSGRKVYGFVAIKDDTLESAEIIQYPADNYDLMGCDH